MAPSREANPLAEALGSGLGRRRKPGESAGGRSPVAASRATERRIAVDIPIDLYAEAKILAVRLDMTVKQVVVAGLRAEVKRLSKAVTAASD